MEAFQSLEKFLIDFPIVGNFYATFSNRWKNFQLIFQSLENVLLACEQAPDQ